MKRYFLKTKAHFINIKRVNPRRELKSKFFFRRFNLIGNQLVSHHHPQKLLVKLVFRVRENGGEYGVGRWLG